MSDAQQEKRVLVRHYSGASLQVVKVRPLGKYSSVMYYHNLASMAMRSLSNSFSYNLALDTNRSVEAKKL